MTSHEEDRSELAAVLALYPPNERARARNFYRHARVRMRQRYQGTNLTPAEWQSWNISIRLQAGLLGLAADQSRWTIVVDGKTVTAVFLREMIVTII